MNNYIDKRSIAITGSYALRNIPSTDQTTVNKFLELINITGVNNPLTREELVESMVTFYQRVPGVHLPTLEIILGLLNFSEQERQKLVCIQI